MKTLTSAREALSNGKFSHEDSIIMSYLLNEALGHENAKTWRQISSHLSHVGIPSYSKNKFQNGLLKRSRGSDFFIGSTDGPRSGYFIIETLIDAKIMESWYLQRIAAETKNLNQLWSLMSASISSTKP